MEAAGVISCAFGLGYVLQSAHSAIPDVVRNCNGSSGGAIGLKGVVRSPRRITLLAFFTSVTIWSTLQFVLLLLLDDSSCKVSSIFVAIFDQLSRILIFGVALCGVRKSVDNGAEKGVLVITVILRVVLGVVVVSFTRHTFIPVCFLQADPILRHSRSAGITQLCFDGVMSLIMLVRAWVAWRDAAERHGSSGNRMGMGLFLVVLSLGGWNLAAATFVLRVGSIFVRLAPTIFTLAILIGLIRIFPDIFFFLSEIDHDRENQFPGRMIRLGSDSSAVHSRGGRSYAYPTGADIEGSMAKNGPHITYEDPNGHRRTNSSVFRNIIGQPIVHPGTMVSWSLEQEESKKHRRNASHNYSGTTAAALAATEAKSGLVETKFPAHAGGMTNISGPILKNGGFGPADDIPGGDRQEPFKNMRTVSLHTAAEVERARIDAQFEREEESRRMDLQSMGHAGPSRSMRIETATTTPRTIASFAGLPTPDIGSSQLSIRRNPITAMPHISAINPQHHRQASGLGISERDPVSPQTQSGYRMSTNTFFTEDDTTRYTQSHAGFALGPPPLPVARSDPNSQRSVGDQRVLFLKDIEYDDPALVHSLMNQKPTIDTARSTGRYTRSYRGVLRRSPPARTTDMKLSAPRENSDESPVLPNGVPVMQRMRSIKRESSRALFPSESRTPEDDRKALRKFSTVSQKMNLASPAPPPTEPLPEPPIPRMPIEHLPIMETLPLVLESKATFPIAESFKVPNAEPPLIPEKSENRLSIQSQNSSESSATDPGDVMYETAKAWVASVAPIHQKAAVPMLVNVSLSRMGSLARRESSASVNNSRSRNSSIEEEKIMGNAEIITLGSSEEVTDRYRDSAIIRKSGITFLASPVLEENEDEEQEAKIGGLVFRRKSYESMNLSDPGFDEVVSLSPDNGYSTNEEENDNDQGDYFSGSSQISIDDNDDVIISDFEDALEFERMHIAKRNLDSKFQDLMNGVSNFDALIMPRHFKLGDRIPNFYSARGNQGYGQKRKSPPVPLGMVPLRPIFTNSFTKGRQSQVQPSSTAINKPSNKSSSAASTTSSESIQPGIQARLTQLMGKHQRPEPLEELIRRLPVEKKQKAQEDHRTSALSDGRGSLIRQLESEVSQQETQWKGMRKSMRHDSLNSSVSSTLDTLASESTSTSERHSQRRSFIAKLSSGIDRRLSTVQTSATTATTATNTSRLSAVDWQRQSAEAKMVYLAEASQLTNRVREDLRLKSDVTMMGTFAGSNLSLSPFPTPLAARAMEIDPCTISNVNLSQRASPKIYTPSEEVELSVMGASTKAYKPQSKMWSAPLVEVEIPRLQVACLWKGGQRAVVPNAVPAAINVRSRKRFDKEQPIVKSSQLWKKSREMPRSANTSLWKNPKDFRPRSIMSHHRRTSSMKRVTFVEEVITVEPTGIMGRLKKLWGGKSSIKKAQSITEVPPPLPSLSQLRTLNRTPISGILDSITKKYEKKALPQLPPKKSLQPQTVFAGKLWVKKRSSGEVAHTHLWPSSLPLCKTFYAEWKRNTRTDNTPVANFLSISGLWGTKMQMHTQPSKKMNVLWPLGTIEQSYSGKGSWRPQNTPQSISRTNLTIDINVIRPVKVAGLTKTIAVHVNKAEASPTGLWLLTQQQKTPITGLLSTQHLNDGMSSVRSSICFEESTIVSAKMVQWTRPSRASVIIDFPVSERKNDVPNLPDRAVSGLWRKRKEVPNGPPCAAAALTSLWERGASRPQHSPQKFSELVGNTQRPYAKSTAQYIDLAVVGGSLWTKTNDPEIDRSHKHANLSRLISSLPHNILNNRTHGCGLRLRTLNLRV
ncbi:hypothetical protein EDC01DRAFT_101096 [Geopyxis carbonaria]|nr:hypothetical protein EDC01DRAFT_101096 [Geopyxis carbonaria]